MSKRAIAVIDTKALRHNLNIVKSLAPRSAILAMVKSNAYGHGLIQIGQALVEHVEGFGVACFDEAVKLRQAGIKKPIILMSGFLERADLEDITKYDLQVVLHEFFQVEILEEISLQKPLQVWLKIDTGMHRLGFSVENVLAVYQRLSSNKNLRQPINLMTHLADADDRNKKTTQGQIELFDKLTYDLPGQKSIANSAGIVTWSNSHRDWVRPGIMLYGVSPLLDVSSETLNLQPVMTLSSRLIAVHKLKAFAAIGYGGAWICPEDMPVGVVAIGYGDGYPRHAKSGTPVLIGGTICPLIGRVSMDMITVDLRHVPSAKVGDEVVLWGNGLPVETVATFADTIAYELLCDVSQRVHFIYQ